MTETTEAELLAARARLTECETSALLAQKHLCEALAEKLPGQIDKHARTVAMQQPSVARTLGPEGLGRLRERLQIEATDVARLVRSDAESVRWPVLSTAPHQNHSDAIRQALFKHLWPLIGQFAATYRDFGFDVYDDNAQGAQGIISSYDLFSPSDLSVEFGNVAATLAALPAARTEVDRAQHADDQAAVESIWEDRS